MGLQQSFLSEKSPSVICYSELRFILFVSRFNPFLGTDLNSMVKAVAIKFVHQRITTPGSVWQSKQY